MEIKRQKFQGVLNILSFNRHFYAFGLIAMAIIIGSQYILNWNEGLFWLVICGFIYGLTMPLIVSAYVYDFSGFYNFDWLKRMNLDDSPQNLNLNINAGFDETSYIIKKILPYSRLQVYDFYNAKQHTEPAITRARKVSSVYPNTQQIDSSKIPLEDNSVDNIFLVSAIHEIRKQEERIQFLKECRRVCKPNGNVIMVEHLRDFPNFFAFTIGFTHFFSSTTWKMAFKEAGFASINESKFTPFMSIFNCK
ncbi:MAG: methyltransferase type 11 [Saprospirales bacterium]|nr:methyltransferase type 11 [Saprospirales bacterium]